METIETPRLLLHKVTPEIYKDLFHERKQDEIMSFLGITTPEEWEEQLQRQREGLTGYRRSFVHFYLQDKATGETIGSCGFHTWYLPHRRAEIGYKLNGDQWKQKGYMKEAIEAVIGYGFKVMNLNRVEAFISPENVPSLKLVAHLGFKQEGRLLEHYCKDDIIEDSLVFGLLRKDFEL